MQNDGSYFAVRPVEAEIWPPGIWPGKSMGLVQGKMGKSRKSDVQIA